MNQYHQRRRIPLPLMLLVLVETSLFVAMPYVATYILNSDRLNLPFPAPVQAATFGLALLGLMAIFGLYSPGHTQRLSGDLLRTTWAFSLAGAGLASLADFLPGLSLSQSVTILALLVGFFVQRTTRLVYFDAVTGQSGESAAS